MSYIWPQFHPVDVIAAMIILALVLLELTGHDGPLAPAVTLIVGYYFGKRGTEAVNEYAQTR